MGQQLPPTSNAEPAGKRRHVLVDGGGAQPKPRRDLFLAVALDEAGERLPKAAGQRPEARLCRAHQLSADQRAELAVKEVQQTLLARREVPIATGTRQMNDIDGATLNGLVEGHESMVGISYSEIPVVHS